MPRALAHLLLASLLPVAGVVLSSASVASAAAPSPVAMDGDDDDFIGEDAWVKLKLTHAGKTHKHPGYLAVTEEEMILTMGKGGSEQEISIVLDKDDAGTWSAKVVYKVGGTTVVTGSQDIRTKKWITFKSADGKSKLELHVDPDSNGGEDIDLGKGNKPLDGLQ